MPRFQAAVLLFVVAAAALVAFSRDGRVASATIVPGTITTVAGGGVGDGEPAAAASVNSPNGLATNGSGAVYFADTGHCRVRKVSSGAITTVAGNGDCAPGTGGGGPATS